MQRRRRHGRRGRIPSPVFIEHDPKARIFNPHPNSESEPVILGPDELEVLRLVDLEDLSQEEAGERMGISRGTIWRLLKSARRKTTLALTDGRTIRISENAEMELKETKK
ncbi:DUF134 domain-containing protein [Candidatus Bathyarchaeota archaeon]|nr:DUF134 domain-containing protein [Candidatus Bathyarchaeota archaeon]